ncbi:uncharacterized protein LOC111110559 isoform X2 [Crassostrea virginica]
MSGFYRLAFMLAILPPASLTDAIPNCDFGCEDFECNCTITNAKYQSSSCRPSTSNIIKAYCSGSLIGAAVGGTLFGSVTTAILFVCCRHKSTILAKLKRSKTKDNNLVVSTDNAFSNGNQETTEGFQQQEELTKKDALYIHLHESEKGVRSDTYMYDHPVFVTPSRTDTEWCPSIERSIITTVK